MEVTKISEGIEFLALKPGDRLAVRFPESFDIEQEELAEMHRVIKEAWPEITPVFFTGDVELSVIRSESLDLLTDGHRERLS